MPMLPFQSDSLVGALFLVEYLIQSSLLSDRYSPVPKQSIGTRFETCNYFVKLVASRTVVWRNKTLLSPYFIAQT